MKERKEGIITLIIMRKKKNNYTFYNECSKGSNVKVIKTQKHGP